MPSATSTRPDLPTLIAMAVLAYTLNNFIHEALGHGGMCWAAGGSEMTVSTMHLACDGKDDLGTAASKAITAAGTLLNLLVGVAIWLGLRRRAGPPSWNRYFWWLLMVLSLLVGGGYLLAFSFFRIGDWGKFPIGLPYEWPLRVGQFLIGLLISFLAMRAGWKLLWDFLPEREPIAARRWAKYLCWVPFFVGGTFAVLSGLPNPHSGVLLLISAVGATFGGAFWLFGMPVWNRDLPPASTPATPSLLTARSVPWIVAAVIIGLLRVVFLGPGLTLAL